MVRERRGEHAAVYENTMKVADWMVDIGPGAGEHGGRVVHSGTVAELLEHPTSPTGAYLSGRRSIPLPRRRRPRTEGREVTVHGAAEHFNLKGGRCDHCCGDGTIRVEMNFLSGGEAQRVKLASELRRRTRGGTVYILDEPTTGPHVDDVRRLLDVLHRLVDAGNTVVVIEHDLHVVKTADWLIGMGPEGGHGGGTVVAQGTPEPVAASPYSYTGRFLRPLLEAG